MWVTALVAVGYILFVETLYQTDAFSFFLFREGFARTALVFDMPQPTLCSCLVAVHYFYLLMLIISDLLFPSFKMGIERANLEDVIGSLAYPLVEMTAENACIVLLVMSLDAVCCHVSKTGFGLVIAALDAESWASGCFIWSGISDAAWDCRHRLIVTKYKMHHNQLSE